MHSRAYILLESEFRQLQHSTREGITAFPTSEDMMSWRAVIKGLQNTIWEGCIFHLTISFTQEYNLFPPVVKFITIPFHPNVDPYTGQPSIDILDSHEAWDTNYTLRSILLALQVLLSNPILENPVNLEAAQLLIRDENMYRIVTQKLFQPGSQSSGKNAPPIRLQVTRAFLIFSLQKKRASWTYPQSHRSPSVVGDPSFMGKYYKWKRQELQHPKQWKLKFGLTKCQFARENKLPQRSNNRFFKKKVVHPSPSKLDLAFFFLSKLLFIIINLNYCSTQISLSTCGLKSIISTLPKTTERSHDYETESEEGVYEVPQEWKNKNSPEESEYEVPLEDEVDTLVAWTSSLNVDSLEYDS
ncbi:ubiquitin-conjugating enzyme E2 U [Acomys russatus]|uniref:ubiquitin-conjugating enzyme E2 U n=1 Tax=Acomys russatus TaxID=60746 RepID=UPI0021E2DBE9|nr:ubiquitin-conjugating enzyme E2 U [Acomys russatus]